MNKDNVIGFGIGILAGAVIGGIVTLLFAPKLGKETGEVIDKVTKVVDAVKEETGEVIDKVTKVVDEVVNTVKEETGGVIDTVEEAVSEAGRKGKAAVKAIKS